MVFLQITWPGLSNSTLGSFAVFSNKASEEIFMPGAIVPPRYSAFSVMAQKVVAVPKSMIIKGPSYFVRPATALTILSAPTCFGLSYLIVRPVFIPGPITIARLLKYFIDKCCNCLLYTSDAADEEDSVDLGGRRIIKKKIT